MLLDVSIEFPNIGLVFKNLPNSFTIFGYRIAFYGVIIMIGAILGMLIAFHEAKITGQNVEHYVDLAIYGLVFAIIGARIYYVVFRWDYYKDNLAEIVNIKRGGLAIYGAILMGMIVCFVYVKRKKQPYLLICDTAILGVVIGQAIGRWGNFFNREAFGTVASNKAPFAMRIYFDKIYQPDMVPSSVAKGMLEMTGKNIYKLGYIQVHPTFLYESVANLCLFVLLILLSGKKKFDGQLFLTYLLGYGVVRFFVEGMRTDQLQIGKTGIAVSQVLSAILVVVACVFMVVLSGFWSKKKYVTLNGRKFGTADVVLDEKDAGNDNNDKDDRKEVENEKEDEEDDEENE